MKLIPALLNISGSSSCDLNLGLYFVALPVRLAANKEACYCPDLY